MLESGESGRVHDRYLEYYLARAKQAEPKLHGAEQAMWIDRLDIEVDNFRAALDWAIKAGQVDQELEMAGALWWFWYIHDYFDEAREHLSAALARTAAGLPGEVRLKALIGLGFIYYAESSMAEARTVLQDAILLSQKLGNRRGLAEALQFLSAVEYVEVSNSGSGDFEDVRNLMEQSLAIWLSVGDKIGISWAKNLLGSVAQVEGDLAQARALWEESVALRRSASDWFLLAYSLRRLAEIALLQGDTAAAEAGYREGHELLINLRSKVGTTNNLVGFAGLALERGQLTRSARILGAIHAILKELALHLAPADEAAYERFLSNAQAQLPEEVFRTAWDEGSVLDIDQAIDYALNG